MIRIVFLLLLASAAWPATYSDTIAKAGEYIRQRMADDGVVGGAVALVDGEEVVWEQGFGWADRQRAVPVTPQTVFHIGSVSKMFVTTAILMLVDEGKVSLDAPVTRYLQDFRLRSPGYEKITVRMLLAHQSGIPGSYYRWGATTAPVGDYNARMLDWLAGQDAQYQPGYTSVYTNNGFNLADEIVSRVSGKPYAQFVRERITEPLGMSHTGLDWLDPALAANLSKGYIDGKEQIPEYLSMLGTGALSSTTGDLCRLLAMVNGGGTAFGRTLLKSSTVAEMNRNQAITATVQVPDNAVQPGLGWDEYTNPGLSYISQAPGKNGGTVLFGTQVFAIPQYRLGVAVTLNSVSSAVVRAIAERILMLAAEERYGIPLPSPVKVAAPTPAGFDLNTLAGAYGSTSISGIWDLRVNGSTVDLWARQGDSFSLMFGGLTHREEGWLGSDEDPETQFAVRRLGGRDVLLMRSSSGHYWSVRAMGERLGAAPALSAAWKARLGKTWVAADMDIANYYFSTTVPALRLGERDGRLVYEPYAEAASSGSPVRDPFRARRPAATEQDLTAGSVVLEPFDDLHAWTPLQVDCRDLTHLRVIQQGKEEWLQVSMAPTLWRPLEGLPEPDADKPYTASIVPERAAWLKLPVAGEEYVLTAPETVHWVLYNDRLQPIFEAWGGAWRLAQPAGSKSSALYLGMYSITEQQAVVQRLQGRTFVSGSGAMRLER